MAGGDRRAYNTESEPRPGQRLSTFNGSPVYGFAKMWAQDMTPRRRSGPVRGRGPAPPISRWPTARRCVRRRKRAQALGPRPGLRAQAAPMRTAPGRARPGRTAPGRARGRTARRAPGRARRDGRRRVVLGDGRRGGRRVVLARHRSGLSVCRGSHVVCRELLVHMAIVTVSGERVLEVAQSATERAAGLRQPLGPEHEQRHDEHEDQMCGLEDVADHSAESRRPQSPQPTVTVRRRSGS